MIDIKIYVYIYALTNIFAGIEFHELGNI